MYILICHVYIYIYIYIYTHYTHMSIERERKREISAYSLGSSLFGLKKSMCLGETRNARPRSLTSQLDIAWST